MPNIFLLIIIPLCCQFYINVCEYYFNIVFFILQVLQFCNIMYLVIILNFYSKVMKLNNKDSVPYLTYNSLSEIKFIKHGFSTRLGGVSKGIFSTMNLAFNRGDNKEDVMENYRRICDSIGLDFNTLVASAQDHNTFVRVVKSADIGVGITKPRDIQSVDALITNEPDVTLVTYYADCTPLFFVDTKYKAVGLAQKNRGKGN